MGSRQLGAHGRPERWPGRPGSAGPGAGPRSMAEAAVEPRVVDEPLPAHRRAGLLEVGPHHDEEIPPKGRAFSRRRCACTEARPGVEPGWSTARPPPGGGRRGRAGSGRSPPGRGPRGRWPPASPGPRHEDARRKQGAQARTADVVGAGPGSDHPTARRGLAPLPQGPLGPSAHPAPHLGLRVLAGGLLAKTVSRPSTEASPCGRRPWASLGSAGKSSRSPDRHSFTPRRKLGAIR